MKMLHKRGKKRYKCLQAWFLIIQAFYVFLFVCLFNLFNVGVIIYNVWNIQWLSIGWKIFIDCLSRPTTGNIQLK